MEPLRKRIPAALALQPMTVDELARCLGVTRGAIRQKLAEIDVQPAGTRRTKGRPWIRYAPMTVAA